MPVLSSTVVFAGRNWLWPLAGILLVATALVVWSYRRGPGGWPRWVCAFLKLLGVAALALCLLEPLWATQRARPGMNLFAVVADNSQGLRIKDVGATGTRAELLRKLLDPDQARWQSTLEDNFEVRRYLFDARLQATRDFSDLDFNGRSSAIGAALHTLGERYHGRPLAGVLLLTDGNATDLRTAPDLKGMPPVYPVVLGSQTPVKDISIEQVQTAQTDFEDAPVSVQVEVGASGYRGQTLVTQLYDITGKRVAEQRLPAQGPSPSGRGQGEGPADNTQLTFRFRLHPEKPGLTFYRVRVRTRSELGSADDAQSTEEATLLNNRAVAVVNRRHGPYRILFVAGRANWEFKFMNRAAQEDPELQLVGLFRVANREPKFDFLGRPGETSNPLFRGFGNQSPDAVERYDQPVLVRINTRDQLELQGGFPKTAQELYGYDAVIVKDLEAGFFTPDQAALLQRFVSERGGGFLMLGGAESFEQGRYKDTPIGDMLPVYLADPKPLTYTGPFHFAMTREGMLQSWARVRDNEREEEARIQTMTPFQVFNPVGDPKPGATLIATVTDATGKTYPALAVQQFGRGRTAALMIGDVWHWGFHDADAHHDMNKAWRQLLRWLVTDVPKRVEVTAQPLADDPGGAEQISVRVRDPKFQPLDDANVRIRVQPVLAAGGDAASTNAIDLRAEPSSTEPGLYQAIYVPRVAGGFQATAWATNSAGIQVGESETGWAADTAAAEFRSLTPNVALLEAIARKTGGEIIRADQLGQFARKLPLRRAPEMEPWSYPIWHTPAMFGFALACLISEWGLRRWKGMP